MKFKRFKIILTKYATDRAFCSHRFDCFLLFQIHETVETINQLKTNREFFLSFAKDPQEFINNWLISQTRDLKVMDQ